MDGTILGFGCDTTNIGGFFGLGCSVFAYSACMCSIYPKTLFQSVRPGKGGFPFSELLASLRFESSGFRVCRVCGVWVGFRVQDLGLAVKLLARRHDQGPKEPTEQRRLAQFGLNSQRVHIHYYYGIKP